MYPHERSLVEEMQGRPFVLLGVNNDGKLARVKKAIRENNLNWRSFWDGSGGPIVRQFGIRSFPTIFLVDHQGVIQFKNVRGPALDERIQFLVSRAESSGDAIVNYDPVTVKKEPEFRTFTDRTGEHTVWAKFKTYADENVTLLKQDGSEITLGLSDLSRRDRSFLEDNGFLLAETTDLTIEDGELRSFTDNTGQFEVSAKLVGIQDDSVTLELQDGGHVAVPTDRLSDDDQQYVRRKRIEAKPSGT